MAIIPPLKLTRDQLASFLQDFEQIKQFENLFATVQTLAPIVGTDFEYQADSAAATANEALSQIVALTQKSSINAAIAENKANQALIELSALAQNVSTNAAIIENKANQSLALVDKLTKAVEGLQMNPPPREFKRARFGAFLDTTTQVATVINTATAVTFNTTNLSQGVFISSPTSRIVVDTEGIYNFAMSFQVDKTSGGVAEFYIWFRLNGVDVPDSAGLIRIQGNNAEIFSAFNLFLDLKANDYVEVMFSVSDLSAELHAIAATPPVPSVPSIILTVNNNIGGIQ
jgi:hypothetical protein